MPVVSSDGRDGNRISRVLRRSRRNIRVVLVDDGNDIFAASAFKKVSDVFFADMVNPSAFWAAKIDHALPPIACLIRRFQLF
jgi:hypothetical protein